MGKALLKINEQGMLVEYNAGLGRWELTSRAWSWDDITPGFRRESRRNHCAANRCARVSGKAGAEKTVILNTWKSTPEKKAYYELGKPIYANGEFSAYADPNGAVIYASRGVAVNCLVRFDKEHVDRLAEKRRPEGEYSPAHFIYDRALENLQLGLSLL